MLLMTFFLSGCRSFERKIICAQIRNHQVPTIEMCDISFKFNRCRCRLFNMNDWTAETEPTDYPLEYCENIAGFFLEDIAKDVRPNVKALANLRENMCD